MAVVDPKVGQRASFQNGSKRQDALFLNGVQTKCQALSMNLIEQMDLTPFSNWKPNHACDDATQKLIGDHIRPLRIASHLHNVKVVGVTLNQGQLRIAFHLPNIFV
jgi:hypothetical protein